MDGRTKENSVHVVKLIYEKKIVLNSSYFRWTNIQWVSWKCPCTKNCGRLTHFVSVHSVHSLRVGQWASAFTPAYYVSQCIIHLWLYLSGLVHLQPSPNLLRLNPLHNLILLCLREFKMEVNVKMGQRSFSLCSCIVTYFSACIALPFLLALSLQLLL